MAKISNETIKSVMDKNGELLVMPTLRLLDGREFEDKLEILKELIKVAKWEDPFFINKHIDAFAKSLIQNFEKNRYVEGYCTGFAKRS